MKALQAVAKGYYLGMKLVRRAYMEKERERAEEQGYPSPIHANKADADRDYDAALQYCVDHLDRIAVCVGTHNEQSTLLMAQLMQARGLPHQDDRIWYGQLLGMVTTSASTCHLLATTCANTPAYGPVPKCCPT
ncbi:MAG: proline dehydrogenase family protein [Dehalococcoidia bacterium]|nr:proline dehydrogenase family protein [Dehalococcoidia bacterium]